MKFYWKPSDLPHHYVKSNIIDTMYFAIVGLAVLFVVLLAFHVETAMRLRANIEADKMAYSEMAMRTNKLYFGLKYLQRQDNQFIRKHDEWEL